jgi:hypothetical protein
LKVPEFSYLPSAVCPLPFAIFPLPHSAFRLPTSPFRLPHSDFRLPLSHFRIDSRGIVLRSAERRRVRLPTSFFCFLPFSHFRIPTSDSPFPTSAFRIPTSHFCLLSSDLSGYRHKICIGYTGGFFTTDRRQKKNNSRPKWRPRWQKRKFWTLRLRVFFSWC